MGRRGGGDEWRRGSILKDPEDHGCQPYLVPEYFSVFPLPQLVIQACLFSSWFPVSLLFLKESWLNEVV